MYLLWYVSRGVVKARAVREIYRKEMKKEKEKVSARWPLTKLGPLVFQTPQSEPESNRSRRLSVESLR